MSRKIFVLVLLLIMSLPSFAQNSKPEPADKILKTDIAEAKSANKNVFVIFHASWCGWCKRLEKAITSDELKNIFNNNFVITHIDVQERGEKIEQLENPGGRDIMANFGGEKSGLPFYVFLDTRGNKITDSNVIPKNSNIGYPAAPEEIEAFVGIVKKSAKHLTEIDIAAITKYFKDNAPKPH